MTARDADWRHEAMNEALRGFDNDEQDDALLREIRRALPAYAAEKIWPDRARLMQFLQEETQEHHNILASCMTNQNTQKTRVYIGWYELVWKGHRIELALGPGYSDGAFCIGHDADAIHQFATAVTEYTSRPLVRCLLYSQGWKNATKMDAQIEKTTWDDIVLAPALVGSIRESVDGFIASKSAYQELGFPWKRGILLIGPPGTGKTMVFKAIAASLPTLPVLYVRDLEKDCSKEDAIKVIFRRARKVAPCILTFEDLDGLIGQHNRTVFLNELDGFESNEGMLIIASSNHPGKIDEALLKRPSRFDRVFHIGLPALEERVEYCRRILTKPAMRNRCTSEFDLDETIKLIGERTHGFTPAYLKEAILSAALQMVQNGVHDLDSRFAEAILSHVDQLKAHLHKMNHPTQLTDMNGSETIGLRRSREAV
jgi:hypothetical protein